MHLRNINAHVATALQAWPNTSRITARLPLQPCGGILSSSCQHTCINRIAGTSSFGMSGVNAHALFTKPEPNLPFSRPLPGAYSRQRFWSIPPTRLLLCSTRFGGRSMLSFSCNLGFGALGYLWDHQVRHIYMSINASRARSRDEL